MKENKQFMTARGYEMAGTQFQGLTASMEDYLEMIYRLGRGDCIRTSCLAEALSVNRSSVTKMIKKLSLRGLVDYEPYGLISLTSDGLILGSYLFDRHKTVGEFLKLIGVTGSILQEVEGIEHNLSQETLGCIKQLVSFIHNHPDWWEEFMLAREK